MKNYSTLLRQSSTPPAAETAAQPAVAIQLLVQLVAQLVVQLEWARR